MSPVVTPEEMAALLEGLREAEDGLDSECRMCPKEVSPRGRGFLEGRHLASFRKLSAWLMALAPPIKD